MSLKQFWIGIIVILFAVGFGWWKCPHARSETASQISIPIKEEREFSSLSKQVSTIAEIDLYIEIPSQRLIFHHHISIPSGSTVSQVVEAAYLVKHSLVCCDSRDIWSINGLAVDPYKEKWWIIKVNGNRQNYSARSKVSNNDIVELVYEEGAGYSPGHFRLEDWVAGAKHGKN